MDHPSDASSQVVMNLHVQISLGLALTLLDKWHIWRVWTYFEQGIQNPACIQQWQNCKVHIYNSWCKMLKIKSSFHLIVQDLIINMKLGNQPSRKKRTPILKYFLHVIWLRIFSICMGMGWWIRWFFLAEHIFEDTNPWLLFRMWHARVVFFYYYINNNTGGIIPQSFWLHSSLQKVSDM